MKTVCAIFPALSLADSVLATEFLVTDADTLVTAILQAAPGDSIVMADGEWRDTTIRFRAMGTEAVPITLQAQTPGQVFLTGKSSLCIIGKHLVVDGLVFRGPCEETGDVIAFREDNEETASHCRLTNSAILEYNPANPKQGTKWISL